VVKGIFAGSAGVANGEQFHGDMNNCEIECNKKTFGAPCNYRFVFVCGTRMRKEAMRKLFYDNKFYFFVCFCQA